MDRREFCGSLVGAAVVASRVDSIALSGRGKQTISKADHSAVTEYVANFIVNAKYQDLPQSIIELGKKSILDGLGLAIAGAVSGPGTIASRYVQDQACLGKSILIGTKLQTTSRFAAFANGVAIHANDYDDTAVIRGDAVHATVPVLPPVFALCQARGLSGQDLFLAYHVGVEVECKISQAMSPRHYSGGFHATGTIGSFGSAAGSAKAAALNLLQTQYALGVTAAEAAGVRANFGTMAKPFQAGHAAESGVVATDLVSLGLTASPNVLEASKGFFEAAGGGFDAAAIVGRLGNPWSFESPGVLIKRFPCGTIQQPVMDEMLRLIHDNSLTASSVESVEVQASQIEFDNLAQHHPTTGLAGKFSMEFCLAVLLLDAKAGLREFSDETVSRADVQEMIARVKFTVDPKLEESGARILSVRLKDGRNVSGSTSFAKGSPQNPMSFDEVAEKFRDCARFAKWPTQKIESIIEVTKSLESESNLTKLAALLTT